MKAKFTLIAAALLVVSNIASAQEQEAPSAKMTGEEMMGHMGCGTKGHGMMRRGMMPHGMPMRLMMILMDTDGDGALSQTAATAKGDKSTTQQGCGLLESRPPVPC